MIYITSKRNYILKKLYIKEIIYFFFLFKINEEMILLYLDVGKYLFELQQNSKYGDKITTKASQFMKNNYPNIKGFTKRNIERMVQFYKIYKDDEIATPLVTQISWTNNLLIISKK